MSTPSIQGLTERLGDTALGLGHLIGQNLKIAQLEVKTELHTMGRRARLIAVLATLLVVGYALAMAGLAALIGGHLAVGTPLVIIGLAHMAGAGAGLVFVPLRARGSPLMGNTTAAMNTSLVALQGSVGALGHEITRTLDWSEWVRRKPGMALALAFALGVFLGRRN